MSISRDEWREVAAYIDGVAPELIEFRHTLHRQPEIGLQTPDTRAAIAAALAGTSARVLPPLLGHDLVVELPGRSARTICLRADMDALPITERTGLPYQSCRPGAMHACGHDGHSAILTGVVRVLDRFRDRLPVSVRFVFQPGEEIVCGGRDLVDRGVCRGVEAAYALHGWRGLPVGTVASRPGILMAAGGFFGLTLTGKGCHGSQPEAGNNPIPCAAAVISDLKDYHDRVASPEGGVVTVCVVRAGQTSNVIPDAAVIEGTFRYLSTDMGDRFEAGIRDIGTCCAEARGIRAAFECRRRYGLPVTNTPAGYERVREAARAVLPEGSWREWPAPVMGSEDFAYYLAASGGAMFFLGLGETHASLHTEQFDFNDAALVPGVRLLSRLALEYGPA